MIRVALYTHIAGVVPNIVSVILKFTGKMAHLNTA